MPIETVNYQMAIPKESKEIVDAIVMLVKHFKEKRSIAELSQVFPQIALAFEGFQKVDAELKSEYRDELVGYLIHALLPILLPVKQEEK